MLKRPFFQKPTSDAPALSTSLDDLREQILSRILTVAIPLGFVAYFYTVPDHIKGGDWGVVTVFTLALAGLISIATTRKIPYVIRILVFQIILAAIGITTLWIDGLYGSGRIFLLVMPISASLLLGVQVGIVELIFSLAAFSGIGAMMLRGQIPIPAYAEIINLGPRNWVEAVGSFALVSIAVTFALNIVMRSLEKTIVHTKKLGDTLETEHAQSDHRILQRTQDLERRLMQLRTTAEIIRSLGSYLDPVVLLQRVVDLVKTRFNLYYVGVFLIDEAGEYAVLNAGSGEAGAKMLAAGHRLLVDDTSMIGWCVGHRQARIALDVGYDAVRFNNPDLPLTRSELALPMLGTKQTIGALTIQSSDPRAFDQDDIVVLQVISDSLATALENARLFQESQENLEEIRKYNKQYLTNAWQDTIRELDANRAEVQSNQVEELSSQEGNQFPLMLRDQEIGKLFLDVDESVLTLEERTFIESVTNQTALALENVRLLEKTQRQASYERLLTEISRKVHSSTDIDAILRITVKELGQILGASEGVIQLDMTNPEKDRPGRQSIGSLQPEEPIQ